MSIGLTFPITEASGSIGLFETTDDEFEAVVYDLHSVLSANWGERPMRFNFGCNFREFVFEPATNPELQQRVADRVLSQIDLWLPFVAVEKLNVLLESDSDAVPPNGVGISMSFRIQSEPTELKTVEFVIDNDGTVTRDSRLSFLSP